MKSRASKAIPYNLRKIRDKRQLTQEQMAKLIKITVSAYAKIERGERVPSIHTLEKISDALGVKLDDIAS